MSHPTRILIIDDEAAIRRFLRVSLEAEGYALIEASTATNGLVQAASARPDLILLDLGLPDFDGLATLKRLREWSSIPVIVLTVRDSDVEKVRLLDNGADDYVTKPFSVPELLARIRAALRHVAGEPGSSTVVIGGLEIDFAARIVRANGEEIHLTVTEYEILRILARHAGKVVTQRLLLREIWGPQAEDRTQYLRVHIGQLRKKIEPDPAKPSLIKTEPGVGYRLLDAD